MPSGEIKYRGPWEGIDASMPEDSISPAASPFLSNVMINNGEITSRPLLSSKIPYPNDGFPVRGFSSFIDSNNVAHTICLTKFGLYQLSSNWQTLLIMKKSPWLLIGAFDQTVPDIPFSLATIVNKTYFTNGGPKLQYWDGIQNNILSSGAITIYNTDGSIKEAGTAGSLFLMELDSHLIMANVTEIGNTSKAVNFFPQRIRWSSSGNPNNWDTNTDVGAGFLDALDTPDIITGAIPIGRYGYVFRTNGISQLNPVGRGVLPFEFNHFWAAEKGIGSVYAQSLANYGSFCCFISSESIILLSASSIDDIGGKAANAIYDDLAKSSQVIGTILPYFSPDKIYHCYYLTLSIGNDTVHWLCEIKNKAWTRWTTTGKAATARPKYVFLS